MRSIWVAGMALLCCLVVAAMPVVAQEEPTAAPDFPAASADLPEASYVTGSSRCINFNCTKDLSDPRVSGEGRFSIGSRCWVGDLRNEPYARNEPGCTSEGTMTIVGPEGRWRGPWAGLWDESLGRNSLMVFLEGTDAYEGWTFVAHYLDTGYGSADVNGVIYRGRPPRMERPVSADE